MSWLDGLMRASQGAPAAATQAEPEKEPSSNNDALFEGGAVAEIEADLGTSFAAMACIEEPVTSPLQQLRAGIRNVVKQQAIVKHGFLAVHHYEQEGCDSIVFGDVPPWINFSRISGYRYRMVCTFTRLTARGTNARQ